LPRITERIAADTGDENANGAPALPLTERSAPMKKRRRFKQTTSFQDRLSDFVSGERAKAGSRPESRERYELLKKVHQAETAANIEQWATAPEQRSKS
jgi:hypothetical protein